MTNQEFIQKFNQEAVKLDEDFDVRELNFLHRGYRVHAYYHTGDFHTQVKSYDPSGSMADGICLKGNHTITIGNYFDDMIDEIIKEEKEFSEKHVFSTNKEGNLVLTFTSNLNVDDGFINHPQGEHESTMELLTTFNEKEEYPQSIEWENPVTGCENIGIEYDEELSEVTGYDGVFELPAQAIMLLEHAGFKVSEDLKE